MEHTPYVAPFRGCHVLDFFMFVGRMCVCVRMCVKTWCDPMPLFVCTSTWQGRVSMPCLRAGVQCAFRVDHRCVLVHVFMGMAHLNQNL
jgi:hypothetical protein